MGLTPSATNFSLRDILFCKAFLGDLIPKGRSLDQSKVNVDIFQWIAMFSKGGVANRG